MRQVVLDTETTGLEWEQGHRIIEIGCVEVENRRRTERVFHTYLNPERDVEKGAFEVHGISVEDLAGKPLFREIAGDLLRFIENSELIIHNAAFDVQFLNAELSRLGSEWGRVEDRCSIVDTLALARQRHPGQKNSLDALCARYGVDNSARDLHGALLDARILADVYLAMTGGQATLILEEEMDHSDTVTRAHRTLGVRRGRLRTTPATAEELAAHRRRLEAIEGEAEGGCLWLRWEQED